MGKSNDSKRFNVILFLCILIPILAGVSSMLVYMFGSGIKNPLKAFKDLFSVSVNTPTPIFWAWFIMYPLMGFVCYQIVNQKDRKRTAALFVYVLQLVFNVLWMPMMFEGWFMIGAIWLFVLVCLIAILIMFTWKIRKGAALLLLPYLVLCLVALFFNGHIALD